MSMAKETEKTEELSSGDRVALFIQNHRGPILVILALVAVGIIGFIAAFSVINALQKSAIVRVDEYARRFAELEDPGSSEAEGLLEDLNDFAPKTFGYSAGKAYSLIGEIHAARKEWAMAEEAWLASSKKAPKIFLAAFSFFNAGVAAEEQGNLDMAIEYHTRCVEYDGLNPAAVRAQFSIGRIQEQRNNTEGAIEAYRKVIENWGSNTNWTNLARSRIIALGG
jgi:tetratricopeptide (TPR) repeat protein